MGPIQFREFKFFIYYSTLFMIILLLSGCTKRIYIDNAEVYGIARAMPESHAKDNLSKYVGRDWVESPFIWFNLTEYECLDDSGLFHITNRTRKKHNCQFSDFHVEISPLNCVRVELWNTPYPTGRRGEPDHYGFKGEILKLADNYVWSDVCPRNREDPEELKWLVASFIALGSIYE